MNNGRGVRREGRDSSDQNEGEDRSVHNMPLRWRLPTEEEASELYRRIDQLIADLFNLIRSIIFGPPAIQQPDDGTQEQNEERSVPDLLANISSEESKEGEEQDQEQPPMR